MIRHFVICEILFAYCFVLGCGESGKAPPVRPTRPDVVDASPQNEQASSDEPNNSSSPSAVETDRPARKVELVDTDWSGIQALIEQQRGKIVVLDVWSTACEPCMKEFPQLISLHDRFSNDVVAISFDVDYAGIKNKPPAYYRERVLNFLGRQIENTVLHRMSTKPADELFDEMKLDSIPAVYVYGRDGQLAKRFDGPSDGGEGISYEQQVIPFVGNLVNQAVSK